MIAEELAKIIGIERTESKLIESISIMNILESTKFSNEGAYSVKLFGLLLTGAF